mgnify:CR=1 FL=1
MGTTACQMTPAKLIASELGLDLPGGGCKHRKLIAKAVGASVGDGRTETWLIIEQDDNNGGRERFGVVALWGREAHGWSHVKLIGFSAGPNNIPPRKIADLMDTVPCGGSDTPEWREEIKAFYADTIAMRDVVAGQRFTVDGYRDWFTATGRTHRGGLVVTWGTRVGPVRFPATKTRKLRVRLVSEVQS